MSSETVLVTGASSGIGLELAKLFAQNGSNLVIVARREDRLKQLAKSFEEDYGSEVTVIAKDLSHENAAKEIFDFLDKNNIEIDVLVNNAGFGAVGKFSDIDHKRQINMLQLNINALTSLTHCFLPKMINRNSGGILNVGSLAGFQPGPYAAVYYATKAYVLSFTESLSEELKDSNVKVSCLALGPTKTEFGEVSGLDKSTLFSFGVMSAVDVARIGYNGFRNGTTVIIPGLINKLLPFMVRISPRFLVRAITSRLNRI